MTILQRNLIYIQLVNLWLSALIIGIEVSVEVKPSNPYPIILVIAISTFLILNYIISILKRIGFNEEYWSFTVLVIIISISVYNIPSFVRYKRKHV